MFKLFPRFRVLHLFRFWSQLKAVTWDIFVSPRGETHSWKFRKHTVSTGSNKVFTLKKLSCPGYLVALRALKYSCWLMVSSLLACLTSQVRNDLKPRPGGYLEPVAQPGTGWHGFLPKSRTEEVKPFSSARLRCKLCLGDFLRKL